MQKTASLDACDLEQLESYQVKMRIITECVGKVVNGYSTGLFAYGPGGMGKSHHIIQGLQGYLGPQGDKWKLHNSRLTAKGLYQQLQRMPRAVHLIEDAESLIKEKSAAGLLRSALWSQDHKHLPPHRLISWITAKPKKKKEDEGDDGDDDECFIFKGGIIITSNKELSEKVPEEAAIRSRIDVLEVKFTRQELLAKMREFCLNGSGFGMGLSADEMLEVVQFIDDNAKDIDLRYFKAGVMNYAIWKDGGLESWQEHMMAKIESSIRVAKTRDEKKGIEADIARRIMAEGGTRQERLAKWQELTGLSQAAFYRLAKR